MYKQSIDKMSKWNSSRPNKQAPASSTSTELGLYISDPEYNGKYTQNIVVDNPAYDAMTLDRCGVDGKQTQKHINVYNTADFMICGARINDGISWEPSPSEPWGNWRDVGGIKVNDHVILRPDTTKITFSSAQGFTAFWSKIMDNGLVKFINDAAKNARLADAFFNGAAPQSGVYLSKYQELPVLEKVETFKLPSSLKFNFQFGQAGLFSAEEEVVKPILAIAKAYMPMRQGNVVFGNVPSNEWAISTTVKKLSEKKGQLIGSGLDVINPVNYLSSDKGFTGELAENLTELQTTLWNALNEAAESIYTGTEQNARDGCAGYQTGNAPYRCIKFRMGRLVLPCLLVKNVNAEFDFSVVDEYGFPFKGSVTLDGLETPVTADESMLKI